MKRDYMAEAFAKLGNDDDNTAILLTLKGTSEYVNKILDAVSPIRTTNLPMIVAAMRIVKNHMVLINNSPVMEQFAGALAEVVTKTGTIITIPMKKEQNGDTK